MRRRVHALGRRTGRAGRPDDDVPRDDAAAGDHLEHPDGPSADLHRAEAEAEADDPDAA
jgi:hypothetical protein